jgi:hypothetical protein
MTTPASPAPGGGAAPDKAQQGAQPAGAQAPPNVIKPPEPEPERKGDLSADEERQLGELMERRDRAAASSSVRLRVTSGHQSVSYGGVTVGRDYTEVPEHAVAGLIEGAANAGVDIEQDQES